MSNKRIDFVIPNGVKKIEENEFRGRKTLKDVKLPESLISIGANAFASTGLERIEIPAKVSSISISPFGYCSYLEEIIVSVKNKFFCSVDGVLYNKNKNILKEYPSGKKLKKFVIPEGVEAVAEKAFAGSEYLLRVEFPRSMSVISARAFSGCYSLQEVIIPDWVTRIERNAFAYCSNLKKIVLPKGIYIEQDAFLGSDDVCITFNETDDTSNFPVIDFQIRQIEKKDVIEPNQIILSKKLRAESFLTTKTEHILSTECEVRTFGKQKIGIDLFRVSEEEIAHLDERGIVKLGTYVKSGDFLVCKGTPEISTPDSRLLRGLFGESAISYADTSLRVPYNVQGEVTDVKIFYEKDKNGNVLHDSIETVSITILQKFPLSIGDVLADDDGNEGVVAAFDPNLGECEIVANFPLGKRFTKIFVAERAVQMRSVGEYSFFGQYPIATRDFYGALSHIVFGIPQKIFFEDITKFANNGLIDVLENIITFQADQPKNRLSLYANILTGKPTDVLSLPASDVNKFFCFLYALCLKPVFYDKKGNELKFSYTEKNPELNRSYGEDIALKIDELSDDEIREMSYGEVTKAETFNVRTHSAERDGLFCEKIFGPVNDWKCRCGKYQHIRYKGVVCEKCGVEVTVSSVRYERFGHIELAVPIKHPFLPGKTLSVLPVLPPELRPMVRRHDDRCITSDLTDLYRRVINRNNRMKRLLELGAPEMIVTNEICMLQKSIDSLFNNSHLTTPVSDISSRVLISLADHLKDFFSNHLVCDTLDFSAACTAMIDSSLAEDKCGLPLPIAFELFKPMLIPKIKEAGLARNRKKADALIWSVINGRNEEKKTLVTDMLQSVMQTKKLLIFSQAPDGEILSLSPILSSNNILTVNRHQYFKLKPNIGESIKIIFPVSDAAQGMLRNRHNSCLNIAGFFEQENNADFVKKIAIASREKDADIVPVLLKSIQNHEVCTFDTVCSRYIFGKPSKWATDFYKTSLISENSDDILEEEFLDYFDDDEEDSKELLDDEEIKALFDDLDDFFDDEINEP